MKMTSIFDFENRINGNLDRNFDETLDRLNYLNMVIRNLKMRDVVNIMDVAEIDEKLVHEIENYEMSAEEMMKDIVSLLVEDAKKLYEASLKNENNAHKSLASIHKIEALINSISNRFNSRNSKLHDFIAGTKNRLKETIARMNYRIYELKEQEKQKNIARNMRRIVG